MKFLLLIHTKLNYHDLSFTKHIYSNLLEFVEAWNIYVNDSKWHLRKNQVVRWTCYHGKSWSLRKYHLAQHLHANVTLPFIQGDDRGEKTYLLYFRILRFPRGLVPPEHVPHVTHAQVLTFVFVVVRDAFDLRAKSRLGDREALGELASSWLPPSRGAPRDRRGRRRGRLRSLPSRRAPTPFGSFTYVSLKTYTGHRPRIIFRSRTTDAALRARGILCSVDEERTIWAVAKTTWRTERISIVSAKLEQSQSRKANSWNRILTKTYKMLESSVSFNGRIFLESNLFLAVHIYSMIILKYRFFKWEIDHYKLCAIICMNNHLSFC